MPPSIPPLDRPRHLESGMLRRNGTRSSCEPCRKAKIKCDHAQPTCSRCASRGIGASCVYHPAPLTKPQNQQGQRSGSPLVPSNPAYGLQGVLDFSQSPQRQRADDATRTTASNPSLPQDAGASPDALTRWPWDASVRPSTASESNSPSTVEAEDGYYGPTSYRSVLSSHFGPATQPQPESKSTSPTLNSSHEHGELGASILSGFEQFDCIRGHVQAYQSLSQTTPIPILLLEDALETLSPLSVLAPAERIAFARKISLNSTRPLNIPPYLPAKQLSSLFSGDNLRWDFIALVFAWAGLSVSMSLSSITGNVNRFPTLPPNMTRPAFASLLTKCSNASIVLSRQSSQTNDVLLWALYENLVLLTFQHGEASHWAWQRLGDISTDIFALGLHQDARNGFSGPDYLQQARRKVFAAAYRIDKSICIFFGRPPRISGHYCNISPPLDIGDEVFLIPGRALETMSCLDPQGWNLDAKLRPASWLRVRLKIARLKEKVLELSLNGNGTDRVSQIRLLLKNSQDFWTSVPHHIRYDPSQQTIARDNASAATQMQLIVYLEHLQNEFQLQRLYAKESTNVDGDGVADVSMRMFTAAMNHHTIEHDVMSPSRDRTWILLLYALPSAGYVAMSLRDCMQQGSRPPAFMSKSTIIRKISVLLAMLESNTHATDANSALCGIAAHVFTRLLDEILDADSKRLDQNLVPGTGSSGENDKDWGFSLPSEPPSLSATSLARQSTPAASGSIDFGSTDTSLSALDPMNASLTGEELLNPESFLAWCDSFQSEGLGPLGYLE